MTTNPNSTEQEELRQAIDDSVLIHTGRSIGDRASQEVMDEIWPLIVAAQRQAVQRFAEGLLKHRYSIVGLHRLEQSRDGYIEAIPVSAIEAALQGTNHD